jgi:hypothetical protein
MAAPTSATTSVVAFKAAKDSPLAVPASGEPTMAEYEAHELAHGSPRAVKDETGTTYAFVLSDQGKVLTFTNSSAVTATIPANASVAFPIGTEIVVYAGGTGAVTIAITSDTLRAPNGAILASQYAVARLTKLAATTWVIDGDLTT